MSIAIWAEICILSLKQFAVVCFLYLKHKKQRLWIIMWSYLHISTLLRVIKLIRRLSTLKRMYEMKHPLNWSSSSETHNPLFYAYEKTPSVFRRESCLLYFCLFHPQGLKRLVSHVKCGVLTCCLGADRLICFLMLLYCLCLSFKTSHPLAVGGCKSISAVAGSAEQKSSRFQAVIVYTAVFPQKKAGVASLRDTLSHKRAVLLSLLSVERDVCLRS